MRRSKQRFAVTIRKLNASGKIPFPGGSIEPGWSDPDGRTLLYQVFVSNGELTDRRVSMPNISLPLILHVLTFTILPSKCNEQLLQWAHEVKITNILPWHFLKIPIYFMPKNYNHET